MSSLFERLGGETAVDAAVNLFYKKVLADDRIKHFFEGVNITRLRVHQQLFFAYAFGGEKSYPGKTLRRAHQALVEKKGLTDEHFDAVIENLGDALKELGVSQDLIAEAAAIAESARKEVLCR